jgi:hypothetical protein
MSFLPAEIETPIPAYIGNPFGLNITVQNGDFRTSTFSAKLVDPSDYSRQLTIVPGTITATDTTITVSDASQLSTTGFIRLDSEVISYQNVSGNQLLNCFRGQNNTTAAAHTTGIAVYAIFLSNINVWPAPSSPGDQYTFVYWRLRRVQDAGGGVNIQDIPFRFVSCMVAGLAFYLAQKLPDGQMRIPFLKSEYEEQWALASTEDRDKSADRYVPRNMMYA